MFRNFIILIAALPALCACNSVYMKPDSLDKGSVIYADRGGYSMRHSIKEELEKRGFNVVVGKAKSGQNINDASTSIEIDTNIIPANARYIVKVSEYQDKFRPIWCSLNGFWWWNFNVSIADQANGHEILSWRGRGCANSSLRKLSKILDEMEK